VEHPFGSIKQWMNQGVFLMRGLEKVRTEFSLTALAVQYDTSSDNRWDRTPTDGVQKCQKPRLFRVPIRLLLSLRKNFTALSRTKSNDVKTLYNIVSYYRSDSLSFHTLWVVFATSWNPSFDIVSCADL
jgi:hypothetical protein